MNHHRQQYSPTTTNMTITGNHHHNQNSKSNSNNNITDTSSDVLPRLFLPLLQALSSLYGTTTSMSGYEGILYETPNYNFTVTHHLTPPLHPLLQSTTTTTTGITTSTDASHHQLQQQLLQQLQYQKNVHSFLLWIQSRNIRRQVQSIYQQYIDSQPSQQQPSSSQKPAVAAVITTTLPIPNHHTLHNHTVVVSTPTLSTSSSTTTNEIVYMGSSWLACITIILRHCCSGGDGGGNTHTSDVTTSSSSSSSTPPPQPMFAIQTMLHRIRRVKIIEAMDIEMEDWYDTDQKLLLLQQYSMTMDDQQLPMYISSLCHTYLRHIIHIQQQQPHSSSLMTPLIHILQETVLSKISPTSSSSSSSSYPSEEQIKAELSIFTLAILIYNMSLQQVTSLNYKHNNHTNMNITNNTKNNNNNNAVTPLLSMTVSTMVTIVFRWWYTTTTTTTMMATTNEANHSIHGPAANTNTSIVSMIRNTYQQITAHTNMSSNHSTTSSNLAMSVALLCTMAAIPDAILASPGGARGRLSIDPRAIQIGSTALRRIDTQEFATILLNEYNTYHQNNDNIQSNFIDRYIIYACERWVTYLPLDHTILSLMQPYLQNTICDTLPLLIAIYESATWTIDQIISSYIGLSSSDQAQQQQQQQQQNKKKQSSRAKKRHKEIVDSHSTDQLRNDAMVEMKLRGDIAYHITIHCWNHLCQMNHEAMELLQLQQNSTHMVYVEGEGPIGCMTACANACLPHIIRYPNMEHGSELFYNISQQIQRICSSSNKAIRALAYEPLYTLHTVLMDVWTDNTNPTFQTVQTDDSAVENAVVDHFFHCAINLASACEYPTNYFDHLCSESDHDLEIERNDVRDLLRTVSGWSNEISVGVTDYPSNVSIRILSHLIDSCKDGIFKSQQQGILPETVVHAFSALAKPINHLSKCFIQQQGASSNNANVAMTTTARHILLTVLHVLLEVNRFVVDAFQHLSQSSHLLLPISRTVNIGNASFAPFLAAISSIPDAEMTDGIQKVLDRMILGSILSLEQIPELAGPSILDHSMYDIRGTMRGPGGEDHVGCLALMRCANEDHTLACRMIVSSAPYIERLCELHQALKQIEVERGPMVFHGRGVTPQTRRILLGSLCHLEVISQGQLGASSMLNQLFVVAIDSIAQFHPSISNVSQMDLFQINESTLDIVAFTPAIIATLFESNEPRYSNCLEVVTSAFVNGYQMVHNDGSIHQWNRQRASLFALVKKSAQSTKDISERAAKIAVACVTAECEAINRQCLNGPSSTSLIFAEDVVSPESIPAGLMVKALADVVTLSCDSSTQNYSALPFDNCLRTLIMIKDPVLSTILLTCPDPQCKSGTFTDPRPAVAEAWFQTMIALATHLATAQFPIRTSDPSEAERLLMETFVAIISLLFYSSLGKTNSERAKDPGMSLDGPHGLAIMSFFVSYFRLQPHMLQWAGERLNDVVPVNLTSMSRNDGDMKFLGIAIIGAALFRACQGALPPWAIESIPEVYCTFFECGLGSDVEAFSRWMHLSMELRLHLPTGTNLVFGGLSSGQLLSGRYFESLSTQAKSAFVSEAKQLAAAGGGANWRRLKGLIKQACGGKKKETDFNQKPSPTRWDFDRV